MNFLLDENFPKSAEKLLVDLGYHVIDIRGTDRQGVDDFQLFEIAQQHEAVLLTTDRDFYHTVPLAHAEHFGVIVIALKQPNREAILSRLRWLLNQQIVRTIDNKVILLRDRSYRIR
jgi:predicted nuclease of predicted toxin-antitoxin system